MSHNPEIIFFDVGNVLLRRRDDPLEIISRHLGVAVEPVRAAHKRLWQRPDAIRGWDEMRTYAQQVAFSEATAVWHLQELGIEPQSDDVRFIERAWNNQTYVLASGAHDVLAYLAKRYRLGVISNAMPSRRIHELVDHNLIDYFDPIIISAELGMRKPDLVIYQEALRLAGVVSEAAAFIDDRVECLEGALAAGFGRVILMREQAPLPTRYEAIQSLRQLKRMF
jgi:HAD superfamily hydrolase (TIGR01509 family)